MKAILLASCLVASGGLLLAQEKPVPKDSTRIFIPGCAKGVVFTVGARADDQPGRSDVAPGRRFRLAGRKQILAEIKAREGTMLEITGLVRKSQLESAGVGIGGHIRVGQGPSPTASNPGRDPNVSQVVLDVEGWRPVPGNCPS